MRKYLLHVLIISFVFLVPTIIHSAEEEKDRLLVVPLKAKKGIEEWFLTGNHFEGKQKKKGDEST